MFKKDHFTFGLVLGLIAPLAGLLLFKLTKFESFTFRDTLYFMLNESGYRTLTATLSVSLLANATLFTIYINKKVDKTAKGIFVTTLVYGLFILLIKTFY